MLATLAVAAVAVIAVGVWWARSNPPVPPDRPAVALSAVPAVSVLALDRPAVAWPDVPALLWRGGRGVSGAEEDLDVAVAAYDAGRFDRAAGRLASVLAREPGLEDARLALGVSLLHLGRSREALAAFEAIATRGDVQLADETRWYAALAALHQDDRPRAIGLLSQLCGGAGHRAAQACLGVDELTRPAPRTLRSR